MNAALKSAFQKDEVLLQDIRSTPSSQNVFSLWWLGQSGFLIHYAGDFLLLDPYLSESLTLKYADTHKPHVRLTERTIDPAALEMVSVVTSSHNHTDHLDASTLVPLSKACPGLRMILPEANIDFAKNRLQGADIIYLGIDTGKSIELGPWRFTGITAAHNEVVRDALGRSLYLGLVISFGPFSVYHSGDTLWHDSLLEELRVHELDVALVPINGNDPRRGVAGNLSALEAAELSKAVGARIAIPHHFEMFAFNTADPQDFAKACEGVAQDYRVMGVGERILISEQIS